MTEVTIRRITPADVNAVVDLVHELAKYDKASEECHLTGKELREALFSERPVLYTHVAEVENKIVGCANWFINFSTWRGKPGIYLEDLYVRPENRGDGIGKALVTALTQESVKRGYARLEWSVLDWNQPAIDFYQSLGASPVQGRTTFRLTDAPLEKLGTSQPRY